MKIALITDTHWGVRNDNVAFMDNSKRFLDQIFFPYIKNNGISTVIHLGDVVDRRKYININTARRLREDFLEPLAFMKLKVHFIAGNHDTYFKNTNEVNALRELIGDNYPDFYGYDRYPKEVEFDNTIVLMTPWICDENRKQSLNKFNSTASQIIMGHLELSGFEMYKGSMVSHGDDRRIFERFDTVLSGHYHHRSSDGSIHYLGNHGEFTWSDYDDRKGFHVLDTETRDLTFIENPYKMFKKIWYNDSSEQFINSDIDYSQFKGCMLKVIVTNKTNPFWFDKFIENIEQENPVEMQIVEDHFNLNMEDDSDIINEAESTLDICKKYIENFDARVNKKSLEIKITDLYNEALAIE